MVRSGGRTSLSCPNNEIRGTADAFGDVRRARKSQRFLFFGGGRARRSAVSVVHVRT